MKRSAFWARLLALVLILGLVIGCFAGCSSKVTDNDDDDDDKGSVSQTKDDDSDKETEGSKEPEESEKTEPTASTALPRPLPTDPSDEVTEPSSEATEPSTEATEPSTEATEPSTEATEPSTEATEPSTEATEPSTEATEPSTEAPSLDLDMVGTYWLYNVIEYGVLYDYKDVIDAGLMGSYMELLADGTIEALSGDELYYMTWDSNTMTITDEDGTYDFTLEDGVLTIVNVDSTLVYAIEGSPLLEIPDEPSDPTEPSDPVTEPTTEPTAPSVETYTVTVHSVDPNWSDLYFWGWNSVTEENLFAEWPGEAMAKSGNVYTIEIPAWVDSCVLYADSCGEQSEDIVWGFEGDVWFVVNLTAITSLDRAPTAEELKPETPEPETFTVHAYVDNSVCIWGVPNMWAWNQETTENLYAEWPGEAMTSEGGGWYTIDLPTTMDAIVISGVGVQTIDILLDGESEVWVVCNSGFDARTFYYQPSGNEMLPPDAPDTFTVRAKVPATWENPGCWAWELGGDNVFEAWPGEAMTLEDGWYTIELPSWADSFLINANEGSIQTGDITLYELSDIWVLVGDSQTFYYDYEPSAEEQAEQGF